MVEDGNKLERGDKVICKSHLWQGKIGRVIEVYSDRCRVCFGDIDFEEDCDLFELFDSEFLER